ncbi:hypothetical protein OF83DRAFT_1171309 [Amylostereum chailletii]|nr:hypothetical protein OF83DRAFT_1171309 [Amylostereum chailletii]
MNHFHLIRSPGDLAKQMHSWEYWHSHGGGVWTVIEPLICEMREHVEKRHEELLTRNRHRREAEEAKQTRKYLVDNGLTQITGIRFKPFGPPKRSADTVDDREMPPSKSLCLDHNEIQSGISLSYTSGTSPRHSVAAPPAPSDHTVLSPSRRINDANVGSVSHARTQTPSHGEVPQIPAPSFGSAVNKPKPKPRPRMVQRQSAKKVVLHPR